MSEHEINRREATLMGLMFAGAGGIASLSDAFAQGPPENSDLVAEIEVELRKQEEIWNSQDYQRVRELWDHDDPEPYFVAAELDNTIIGWPALNNYLAPTRSGLAAFRWGFSNVHARLLAPDVAMAVFDHWFEFQLAFENAVPKSGFDRLLCIFNRKPDGWKQIVYANCPHSFETHARKLVERNVRPDFAEFREEAIKKRQALEQQ
jgi:hypothetical protein